MASWRPCVKFWCKNMFRQFFDHELSYRRAPKGQLISEQIYAALNFPKMQRNIARISALASKMGQIQKVLLRIFNSGLFWSFGAA